VLCQPALRKKALRAMLSEQHAQTVADLRLIELAAWLACDQRDAQLGAQRSGPPWRISAA
jgi:hypothetical protein